MAMTIIQTIAKCKTLQNIWKHYAYILSDEIKIGSIPEESLSYSSNPLIKIQTMPIKLQIKNMVMIIDMKYMGGGK